MEKLWPCVLVPQQSALEWMALSWTGFSSTTFADVVDFDFAVLWAIYQGASGMEDGLALWKRNYGIVEIELEGVRLYSTTNALVGQVAAAPPDRRVVGQRCPCRFRDGWQPPVPICP